MPEFLKRDIIKKVVIPILMVLLFVPIIMYNMPQEANFNATVYDDAGVLSQSTEAYITQLNNKYNGYERQPQLIFVTVDSLVAPIDLYKHQVFNELGLGDSETDCGILFVLAINNRTYGMEVGDGFKNNTLLMQDLTEDFLTDHMIALLQAEMYDDFVIEVSNYIDEVLRDDEHGYYDAALEERNMIITAIVVIIVLAGATYVTVRIVRKLRKCKVEKEAREDSLNTVELFIKKYNDHLELFGAERAIFEDILRDRFKDTQPAEIKYQMLDELYANYENFCIRLFNKQGDSAHKDLYIERWRQENPLSNYEKLKLVSVHDIIQKVEAEEAQSLALVEQNKNNITQIFNGLANTLPPDIVYETLDMVRRQTPLDKRLLSREEIIDNIYLASEAIQMETYSQEAFQQIQGKDYRNLYSFYKSKDMYLKLIQAPNRPECNIPWSEKKRWIDQVFWGYIQDVTVAARKSKEENDALAVKIEEQRRRIEELERQRREEAMNSFMDHQEDEDDDDDGGGISFPLGNGFSGHW